MNRIILFRYHKMPLVCRDRLRQLKYFNPGVKIFGVYGGKETEFLKYEKSLKLFLEHNYCVKDRSEYWKWKNSDLIVRLWYRDIGNKLSFDMLHIIEWDLLLFDSLNKIYKKILKNSLGLTALVPLEKVEHRWTWTAKDPYRSKWLELLKYVKDKFDYHKKPYASLGPGSCLPRKFLEKFSSLNIPNLSNDELRLPLFGQILGFRLIDTGFYEKWFDLNVKRFFNCRGNEISLRIIEKELKRKDGRKSFHPYRKRLNDSLTAFV